MVNTRSCSFRLLLPSAMGTIGSLLALLSACGTQVPHKVPGWLRGVDAEESTNQWNESVPDEPHNNPDQTVDQAAAVSVDPSGTKRWLMFDGEHQQGLALSEIPGHADAWVMHVWIGYGTRLLRTHARASHIQRVNP